MIFEVSKKLKGSCVLSTLNKVLNSGMTIMIGGNDLYAPDVKAAIKNGILVPVDEKYTKKMSQTDTEVVITNRTKSMIVLDKIVLKPSSSTVWAACSWTTSRPCRATRGLSLRAAKRTTTSRASSWMRAVWPTYS